MREFVFKAKVTANSQKFEILGFNTANELKIKAKSPALEGRANLEIVRELKKKI